MISLGLIGFPLEHSLSPKIHEAALLAADLKGQYSLFPVPPSKLDKLQELLEKVRSGEILGLNVTIPHKQSVIPFLDELTPTAQAIGAVNTIYLENDKLIGENTDAQGFLLDLKSFLAAQNEDHLKKAHALLLGAGGSARAVLYALIRQGWDVTIAARRPEQAQELIDHFPGHVAQIKKIDLRAEALSLLDDNLDLIINATPLGMHPNVGEFPWPVEMPFPQQAVCYDLVYNPSITNFVREARNAGASATTGMGMLIEQAVLSFEHWTGTNLDREKFYASMEEK